MHSHDFHQFLFGTGDPDGSYDQYLQCPCGRVMHVYTFKPYDIRHERIFDLPKERVSDAGE